MRRIFTITLASLAALSLGACSTSQLAQQSVGNDDVYGSVVTAKEVPQRQERESSYRTDEELYGGNDYSDAEYEGEYASRIERFYYNRPWRSFYDSYYSYRYDPWFDYYGYNSFYRPGFSFSLGFGSPWYYDNYYWGFYGSPYYSRYWGPYSYYSSLPYYGYYPGYGSYYPGGIGRNRDYRARPNRETNLGRGVAGGYYPGTTRGAVGTRSSSGRPERYTPSTNSGRTSSRPATEAGRTSSRPARTEQARPPRESSAPRQQQPRPEYSRPERTSSGGSTSGSSGRSSGGSSSSGSSSSSGRPSRGNR